MLPHQAELVFLPFIKKVPQAVNVVGAAQVSAPISAPKPKPMVKQEAKGATIAPKPIPKKPVPKVPAQKKVEPKMVPKKEEPCKSVEQKPLKNAQQEKKDDAQKKKEVAQSAPSKAVENISTKTVKTTVEQTNVAEQLPGKDVVYMGSRDKENRDLIATVKKGIAQQWVRPAGLLNHLNYEALVYIDLKGSVSLKHEKRSGALVLDAAARLFVLNYRFPKSVWGRQIEIVL